MTPKTAKPVPCPDCGTVRMLTSDRGQSCHECGRRKRAKATLGLARLPVTCPACRGVREVVRLGALAIYAGKRSAVCRSCAMKGKRRYFQTRACDRCGGPFEAEVGQKRSRCDECGSRTPFLPVRECVICGRQYRPKVLRSMDGEGCSRACKARIKLNVTYFGGRMFEAEGWEGRICQACGKSALRRFQVHHVYGHPDHSRLMVLCPGCHSTVSYMARTKRTLAAHYRLAELAEMQRRRGPLEEAKAS